MVQEVEAKIVEVANHVDAKIATVASQATAKLTSDVAAHIDHMRHS
jgi:hypothetical protein